MTPSPPSSGSQLTLHPLLNTTQHTVKEGIFAHILWDLREHPFPSARYVEDLDTPLTSTTLREYATVPLVPFLQITCDYPSPWDIIVTSSTSPSGNSPLVLATNSPASATSSSSSTRNQTIGITVYDVLKCIHTELLQPVTKERFEALPERTRTKVTEAFERRWKTSITPTPEEVRDAGVKKVDLLMQHTLFGGLSVDPEKQFSCILSLRRPM